jgi:hypothetical protein
MSLLEDMFLVGDVHTGGGRRVVEVSQGWGVDIADTMPAGVSASKARGVQSEGR